MTESGSSESKCGCRDCRHLSSPSPAAPVQLHISQPLALGLPMCPALAREAGVEASCLCPGQTCSEPMYTLPCALPIAGEAVDIHVGMKPPSAWVPK